MHDRVSVYGPHITKQRAQELCVLESASGFIQDEDGAWHVQTPADKPKEQSTAVPPPQPINNVQIVEEDGIVTMTDSKGNKQQFSDSDSCVEYLKQTLGNFTLTKKKGGVYVAKRDK